MTIPATQRASGIARYSGGLVRRLSLTHAVLYGLGVTIGAGIYVLVGVAAGRAGVLTPLAFVIAAVLMGFTAACFAELAGRMPVAAGEAEYVRRAFSLDGLAALVGFMVIGIAVISAAAISLGSAGYIAVFVPAPVPLITAAVVVAMGMIAAWGIKESVTLAGAMTIIEVGGLLVIIALGPFFALATPEKLTPHTSLLPESALSGLLSAALLGVFAFVGFEGLANIAEEVENPKRTLPLAIFITLGLTTLLYVTVVSVAVYAATPAELAAAPAPLALVFERVTGASPRIMSAIAIVATLNGIVVQMIMASRVLYGLSRQGNLPLALGTVHRRTRTPVVATAVTVAAILILALFVPLERLADVTSWLTLIVFAAVNAALIRIKAREPQPPPKTFTVPAWVPWAGLVTTVGFLAGTIIAR